MGSLIQYTSKTLESKFYDQLKYLTFVIKNNKNKLVIYRNPGKTLAVEFLIHYYILVMVKTLRY
jgi:hypothetical protein